ncbi:MAG TPA: adenylyltransferase/cytidyltransferase family protein, partial [Chitinophagales bacterium]|nr:adenylyltransferase/cytidyltransferase family protein [Chitinophagales bacterium]
LMENNLSSILNKIRKDNTIVFTNGCFDLLHEGHLHLLKEAKKLGDILIIGINDDASVKRLKGNTRPIEQLETRILHLNNTGLADFVIPFTEDTPLSLIEKIQPQIIVKGSDYTKENIIGSNIAEQTVIIPIIEGFSTTKKIEFLQKNSPLS